MINEERLDVMVVEDTEDTVAVTAAVASSAETMENCGGESSARKRKFPTLKSFAQAGGDKMKRKIAPIEKWTALQVKEIFLVRRIISIQVTIKKRQQEGFYAELEDASGVLRNVWISDIIKAELDKHPLEEGNTYIIPLGSEQSRETGHTYNNFAVQEIQDE